MLLPGVLGWYVTLWHIIIIDCAIGNHHKKLPRSVDDEWENQSWFQGIPVIGVSFYIVCHYTKCLIHWWIIHCKWDKGRKMCTGKCSIANQVFFSKSLWRYWSKFLVDWYCIIRMIIELYQGFLFGFAFNSLLDSIWFFIQFTLSPWAFMHFCPSWFLLYNSTWGFLTRLLFSSISLYTFSVLCLWYLHICFFLQLEVRQTGEHIPLMNSLSLYQWCANELPYTNPNEVLGDDCGIFTINIRLNTVVYGTRTFTHTRPYDESEKKMKAVEMGKPQ